MISDNVISCITTAFWLILRDLKLTKLFSRVTLPTFPMGLSFNYLTDAPWTHCILGCQGKFVPGATLQVLQTVWTLTRADGKTAPLLTVVFWVLQDVTWGGRRVTYERSRKHRRQKTHCSSLSFIYLMLLHHRINLLIVTRSWLVNIVPSGNND